jgi:hypothetical protein
MAAKAKLSVLGLYQWNHNIFADMALPEDVDGEVLTWKILEDCAEMEILYSDPEYMRASIYNWSSAMLPSWTKMQEALTAEYNPIWNKDGTITDTMVYGQHEMQYGEDKVTDVTGPRDQTMTHSVAGFNAATFQNAEQDHGTTVQATDTSTRTQHSDVSKTHTDTRTTVEQGNIGVTESSAMVRHEVELRSDFNIYKIIANDFKKHYCLMVY